MLNGAQVHGDFQTDVQSYKADPAIGAPEVPECIRSNTFANLVLSGGKFSAGVRNEAYLLAASIYPYATQPLGEVSTQAELTDHLPGGKYGTDLTVNFAAVNVINKRPIDDLATTRIGYETGFFKANNQVYFRDFNVELHHRFTTKLKANAMYVYFTYNKDVIQGLSGFRTIDADLGVVDVSYKLTPKHSLHGELQTLQTKQDQGQWAPSIPASSSARLRPTSSGPSWKILPASFAATASAPGPLRCS